MLETSGQENILVIGQTGSGKSIAVAELVNHYSLLQKKILVIGFKGQNIDYNSTTIKSIFYKFGERIGKEELSRSLSKETFDVVVVDEIHILSDAAKDKLFRFIVDRPGIKFVITTQDWLEEYLDKRKYFAKAFIGKVVISGIYQLNDSLGISKSSLELCSQIEIGDYSFVCFDLRNRVLAI